FFFSSRRRHTRLQGDWSSDVCSSDLIVANGISHYFDSFECAIHALAPVCEHCGCKIIGHGIEAGDNYYCCASCAHHEGVTSVQRSEERRVGKERRSQREGVESER